MNFNRKTSTAVAALTLTAILLGVILLASAPARGGMLNAQADFSLMTAGPFGADESLVIIDKSAQKIVIFTLDNRNRFNLVGGQSYASHGPAHGKK